MNNVLLAMRRPMRMQQVHHKMQTPNNGCKNKYMYLLMNHDQAFMLNAFHRVYFYLSIFTWTVICFRINPSSETFDYPKVNFLI